MKETLSQPLSFHLIANRNCQLCLSTSFSVFQRQVSKAVLACMDTFIVRLSIGHQQAFWTGL